MGNSSEQARSTPVTDLGLLPASRGVNIPGILVSRDVLMRLNLMVTFTACVVASLALILAITKARQPMVFAVLDPAGTVIVTPGLSFLEAKELHVQQAMLATSALLSRNPSGFDQSELLNAQFSRSALDLAAALKKAESPEFLERQIQQKALINRIDAVETRKKEIQVQVGGQLLRSGVVKEATFQEAIGFTLRLTLIPNLDLLRNRRQPTIVKDFSLKYETPAPSRSIGSTAR